MLNIDKLTYSIGQVSEITEVAQSTLRYWETVIKHLKPQTTPGGSRRYSRGDIELIDTIKNLLYKQGYTIKGANYFLQENSTLAKDEIVEPTNVSKKDISLPASSNKGADVLKAIIVELEKIQQLLK